MMLGKIKLFQSHKINTAIVLIICSLILYLNYTANYACGKFTDSMVARDLSSIMYFLWLCIILWVLFSILSNLKDFTIKKIAIDVRFNMYGKFANDLEGKKQDIDIFCNLYFKLVIKFIESIGSIIVFSYVLFCVAGWNILLSTFGYSLLTQSIDFYFSKGVHKTFDNLKIEEKKIFGAKKMFLGNLKNDTIIFHKQEMMLFIIRNIIQNLKGYIPYFILIFLYLSNDISLGDTTKSIVAFKYVLKGLSFFVDHKIESTQIRKSQKTCFL